MSFKSKWYISRKYGHTIRCKLLHLILIFKLIDMR